MQYSAASFLRLTEASTCTSAKCAGSLAILTLKMTNTSKPCAVWATSSLARVRPKRAPDEESVPQDFPFVLAGNCPVRRVRNPHGSGLSSAAQPYMGVVAQHRPGGRRQRI